MTIQSPKKRKVLVTFPEPVLAKVEAVARREARSRNAMVVRIVEQSLRRRPAKAS